MRNATIVKFVASAARLSATEMTVPASFWEDKDVYIQTVVEKIDLVGLFREICEEYRIPIANARGWSDLHLRANLMSRFREHEEEGRRPVLLYCGDHDPAGLAISDTLKENCREIAGAVDWNPDDLTVGRFDLNADFIEEQGLPWIQGLKTGSGQDLGSPRHAHYTRPYGQEYIRRYGKRKVEANALVARPEAGRRLFLAAIHRYLSPDSQGVRTATRSNSTGSSCSPC
jgi:hypothetical protein